MADRDLMPSWQQNTSNRARRVVRCRDYLDRVFNGGKGNDQYLVSRNRFFGNPDTHVLLRDISLSPYIRPGDPAETIRMWFGPAGTLTRLHYDDRNNLLVQVVGRKRVRLYAPYFSDCMEQRMSWYADIDPETADPVLHPRASAAVATTIELNAGDALFIPVAWWHAIEAIEVSITLSFRNVSAPNEYGVP